jgi:hypothetical protein
MRVEQKMSTPREEKERERYHMACRDEAACIYAYSSSSKGANTRHVDTAERQ